MAIWNRTVVVMGGRGKGPGAGRSSDGQRTPAAGARLWRWRACSVVTPMAVESSVGGMWMSNGGGRRAVLVFRQGAR